MYGKSVWKKYDNYEQIMKFNEEYKDFISFGKTERLCVNKSIELAEKAGFKNIKCFDRLRFGDKVYATNKGKNIAINTRLAIKVIVSPVPIALCAL